MTAWRKLSFEEIFDQLRTFSWTLSTCDMGYRCELYQPPEKGNSAISVGIGDTIPEAICTALLTIFQKQNAKD